MTKTKFEVMDICNKHDIPVGPILSMKEIAEEPSLRATGTVVEVDHPGRGTYLTVGNPIKLSDSPADVRRSPLLGEHTDEILRKVHRLFRQGGRRDQGIGRDHRAGKAGQGRGGVMTRFPHAAQHEVVHRRCGILALRIWSAPGSAACHFALRSARTRGL